MKRSAPDAARAVATLCNNEVVMLGSGDGEPIDRDTPVGARVCKRSMALLLSAAAEESGRHPLRIEASLAASLLCILPGMEESGQDAEAAVVASQLTDIVRDLIKRDLTINRVEIPRNEALQYFEARGSEHTLALVRATMLTHIACVSINTPKGKRVLEIAHSPVVPSTGLLDASHVLIEALSTPSHFRLHHGGSGTLPTAEPMLLGAYLARRAWANKLKLGSVSEVNAAICEGQQKSLVQLSEAEHDRQVVQLADRIAGDLVPAAERPRLVLIAGPTSSGKTTFARRLCVALETLGAAPTVVSVDAYYRAWREIDARGAKHVDWESLEALNLPLLNEHLLALLAGNEVRVPEYDMKTSMPADESTWTPTRLRAGGLIIMEGIHCLNPALTSKVERKDKLCIAITPLPALAIDDITLLSPTQLRMLRRMVRDFLNRGRSASATLKQWAGVARGERANIYPHQNRADAAFNSALAYEANVLRVYAEPLLRAIAPDAAEYGEARRLLGALERLAPMPATLVPPQSLLREFIGGSWFYDFAGWYKSA